MALPGWESPSSVVTIHATLEASALIFFAALVVFDVSAHLNKRQELVLERLGLVCFGIAVLAEILAYPYSRRNDFLSEEITKQISARLADAISDNTDLRAAMEPRRAMFLSREVLSLDEQRKLIREFAAFSGTPLFVQAVFDSEPRTLANDLLFVFGGNKWDARAVGESVTRQPEIAIGPGVQVWTWKPKTVPPAPDDQSLRAKGWRAGDFVTRYLHGSGFFMAGHFEVDSMEVEKFAPFRFGPPENAVLVFIGAHNIDWDAAVRKSLRSTKHGPSTDK
jgi:hypothetical protein